MDKTSQTPEEFFAALDSVPAAHPNDALVAHGKRLCPICQKPMQVETLFRIAIDVCPAHGNWLDQGELEELLNAVKAVDPVVGQQALEQARAEGRLQGGRWGWLRALLLDFRGTSDAHNEHPTRNPWS